MDGESVMTSSVVSDNFETSTGAIPTLGGDSVETRLCRAWVNFNGTGTVAIRASYNVSSITDNGTGDYTVNFITAMSDVNYEANTSSTRGTLGLYLDVCSALAAIPTTTTYRFYTMTGGGSSVDSLHSSVSIFR